MEKRSIFLSLIIGFFSIVVVFFLPFGLHFDLGPGPNSLLAFIWEIPLEPAWYSIRYFSAFQYYFPYSFFRLFFLLEIGLLFGGKYNRTRFFIIGLVSELIPLFLSIPATLFLNSQGENLVPIILPIPILLIFDIILIYIINRLNLYYSNSSTNTKQT